MFKTLVKANDDLISHCKCAEAFATSGQADCPWCGCGWLFTCVDCRKAFTFAKVAETGCSPEDLAHRDFLSFGKKPENIDPAAVKAKAEWLQNEIAALEPGTICVIVDGEVIPVSARNIEFDGWFAHHTFDVSPQVAAADAKALDSVLGDRKYWTEREYPPEE
jgi:hypothetical protein